MKALVCAGKEEGDVWAEVQEDGRRRSCGCIVVVCYVDLGKVMLHTTEGVEDCPERCANFEKTNS